MILSPDSSQQCCPQPPRVPEPSAPSPTTVGHREPALNIGTYVYKWMTGTTTTTYLHCEHLFSLSLMSSVCAARERESHTHFLSEPVWPACVSLCYRIRWDHSAMPGVRGQGIWLPLWSTFMRGMQGKLNIISFIYNLVTFITVKSFSTITKLVLLFLHYKQN